MKSFYKNQNLNLIASTAQQIVFNNSKNGKLESTNTQDAIDEISNILDEEKTIISDEWNSATTYEVGKYCIYNNTLWKCLVQHNGQEPSEGTYWTKTQIDDEILSIKNDVSTLNSNLSESIKVTDSSGNVYGTLTIETRGKIAQVTFMSDNAQTQERVTSINKVSKLPKTVVFMPLFSISDAVVYGYITIGTDGTVSILKSYNWVYGSNAYVIV